MSENIKNENKKVNDLPVDPVPAENAEPEAPETPEVPAPVEVKKDRIDIWYEKRVARREAKAAKKAEKKQTLTKKEKAKIGIGAALVIGGAVAGSLIKAALNKGDSDHIDGSDLITDAGAEPENGVNCDQLEGSGEET